MSVCSKHRRPQPDCRLCQTSLEQFFAEHNLEDWKTKKKEAEEAGTETCSNCKFVFFRTVTACPLCGTNLDNPAEV